VLRCARRPPLRWSCWLVILPLFAGCAAGRAAVALVRAQSAVDDAQDRGAMSHAAYELTMGQAYLNKAREEASFSSYKTSVELARTSEGWADRALITMLTEGTGGAAKPGGDPPTPGISSTATSPAATATSPAATTTSPSPTTTSPSPTTTSPSPTTTSQSPTTTSPPPTTTSPASKAGTSPSLGPGTPGTPPAPTGPAPAQKPPVILRVPEPEPRP